MHGKVEATESSPSKKNRLAVTFILEMRAHQAACCRSLSSVHGGMQQLGCCHLLSTQRKPESLNSIYVVVLAAAAAKRMVKQDLVWLFWLIWLTNFKVAEQAPGKNRAARCRLSLEKNSSQCKTLFIEWADYRYLWILQNAPLISASRRH